MGDLKNTFDSEFSVLLSYTVYGEHDLSFLTKRNNEEECSVFATDPAKIKGKLIISATSPEGKRVTDIGFLYYFETYAFNGAVNLTSVLIHDGINTICANSFRDCSDLKRINVPTSVTEIGEGVFSGTAVKTNELHDEVTKISLGAFSSSKLKSIHIPSSVTDVGSTPFAFCEDLTEITVDKDNPRL